MSFDLQEKKLFRQAELEQKVSSIRVPGSDILFFLVVPSILGLISRLALIIKNTFSKFIGSLIEIIAIFFLEM